MKFMEWPAPQDQAIGSRLNLGRGKMSKTPISVLGIDLGKNGCSVGMGIDDPAWDHSVFSKNRDRGNGNEPPTGGGRNAEVNFRGDNRTNQTHVSTSDPNAMLYRKGPGMEAKLCFIGHALMENRHGLFVNTRLVSRECQQHGCLVWAT